MIARWLRSQNRARQESKVFTPSLDLPRPHNLREDGNRNIYVHGIVEAEVKTADEALKHFYQGSKRRRVASTALNEASSRSHSIFTIRIVRAGYDPNYDEVIQDNSLLTVSQLCLVDLAGSERTSRSGTTGHRLKEASQINNSLMNLRRCIDVLRTNQMASPREDGLGLGVSQTIPRKVPYRDTKLTHLFKSYFEGSGQVLVLICIRPKVEEYDETVHVLEFAEHSQSVTTTTTVPSTPRATPVSSRGSSPTLEAANDELLAAIERCQALDKDLQVCVSKILDAGRKLSSPSLSASESFFDMPLICCPTFDESDPDRDKSSDPESAAHPLASWRRSSNAQKSHHLANNCPLFEVLRARATERSRARELLERVSQDVQSSLMNMVRPADARSAQLALLDSLNSMTVEKQRMESKIRHLENEVAKNRLLARHEKSERLREADNARAQLQRLRNHVQDMTPNCRTPHTRVPASGRKRASKMDTDAEEDLARDKRSRNENSPPTVGRVAALSRRYESRLQEETGSVKRGAQTAVPSTAPVRRLRDGNSRRHTPTSPLADILNRPAPVNPRHRRSKSAGGGKAVWLEHKEIFAAPLGTILAPSIKARKSATQVELKDTLVATDYLLHHQTTDLEGNVETRLFKGSILPTAGGGSAVIFNDVEELRQKSPLRTSLRRSRRQSSRHSRTSQPPEDSGAEEGDVAPTPAKRRTSTRSRRSKHSSLGSQSSAAVRSIDSASDLPEEEDVTSQASSYYPVNPPTKDSPPSAFPTCLGIGISSGGGIGHSAGCRK
ncbi:Kinesin-like protein kif23 [Sparganum proliferum]